MRAESKKMLVSSHWFMCCYRSGQPNHKANTFDILHIETETKKPPEKLVTVAAYWSRQNLTPSLM